MGSLARHVKHHPRLGTAAAIALLGAHALEPVPADAQARMPVGDTGLWPGRNGTSWLVTRIA